MPQKPIPKKESGQEQRKGLPSKKKVSPSETRLAKMTKDQKEMYDKVMSA